MLVNGKQRLIFYVSIIELDYCLPQVVAVSTVFYEVGKNLHLILSFVRIKSNKTYILCQHKSK